MQVIDNLSSKSSSYSARAHDENKSHAKANCLIDDDDKNIWSGFVTRNKQNRVLMDAYLVQGTDIGKYLTDHDHNINITHYTNLASFNRQHLEG